MMSIPATEEWSEQNWSKRISQVIGNYDQFGNRPWLDIQDIEFLPGVHIGDDVYEVPHSWLPPGARRRDSWRKISIANAENEPISAATPEGQSIRRSLVALGLPRQTETGIRTYKPSSWMQYAKIILHMARFSISLAPSPAGSLWSHLGGHEWEQLKQAVGNSGRVDMMVRQLRGLGLRGLLTDFPANDLDTLDDNELDTIEAELRNRSTPVRRTPTAQRTYIPFPDPFVTEFISRSTWFQEVVGIQLIECWVLLLEVKAQGTALGRSQSHPATTKAKQEVIAAFDWRDMNGRPLSELPWPATVRQAGRSYSLTEWPPRDASAINKLVGTLQAMNFCVVAFCTGARSSEILSATSQSLEAENGRLLSRTFKLVDELDGQLREWPLHPAAIRALELQSKLATAIRPADADHIWVLLNNGSAPAGSGLYDINAPVVRAVETLHLQGVLGDTRPHSHRWRHTVGRLVALSVSMAPQVLQDLFGHRDLEMTFRYMLSDPEVAQEAIRVAEEVSLLVAQDAIHEVEKGLAGGPAVLDLEAGLTTLKIARGEEVFSAEDMRELAEVLTFGGRYWQIVRPGVLCTKSLGQFGPCNRGRGSPDAGSCRTDCDHRLETSRARRDCEELLAFLLVEHANAAVQGREMIVANLEGQILSNLKRWEEIRTRVISRSQTAARIWAHRGAA